VAWGNHAGEHILLVTEKATAPPDIQALFGDSRDRFVIKYPYDYGGTNVVLLCSGDEWSYTYPVYYFLQEYVGVGWVGPGPEGERVPSNPGFQLPPTIDVIETPDFDHRGLAALAFDVRHWRGAGGNRHNFHHAEYKMFPPEVYGGDPTVYPLYEGERHVPNPGEKSAWHPCITHPNAVDRAIAYAVDTYDSAGGFKYTASLSVNDGLGYCLGGTARGLTRGAAPGPPGAWSLRSFERFDPGCKCLDCDSADAWNHGNPHLSDRYYKYFYDPVLVGVKALRPDCELAVLAYNRVKTVPTETTLTYPLFVYNVVDDTAYEPDMCVRATSWASIGAWPCIYTRTLDTFLNGRHYVDSLGDLIDHHYGLGGKGFYSEYAVSFAIGGARNYVLAHKLWDTTEDVDSLTSEYCDLAFGASAGPFVRQYLDRWEEIWERHPAEKRYCHTRESGDLEQLEHIVRADIDAMNTALVQADAQSQTADEQACLTHVRTYWGWLKINADQYVVSQELVDPVYRSGRTAAELLAEAERGIGLTAQFDDVYATTIGPDTSGWYLSWRLNPPCPTLPSYYQKVRDGVVLTMGDSITRLCAWLTSSDCAGMSPAELKAYWYQVADDYPALIEYALTEISLSDYGEGANLIGNPGFELGTSGPPVDYSGWVETGDFQGIPTEFFWDDGTGRTGKAAEVGCGRDGKIYQNKVLVTGHRYRFSFWYKHNVQPNPSHRLWVENGPEPMNRLKLPPSVGAWTQFSINFTEEDPGNRAFMINAKLLDKGQRVYLDDVELVQTLGDTVELTLGVTPAGGSINVDALERNYTAGTLSFVANEVVELRADSDEGYGFVSWDGDASGSSNPISVPMDVAKSITAVFEAESK